jgi:hypothetical protein
MQEKLDPVSRFQPEMFPNRLGDRRLAFEGDCGFHCVTITFYNM